MPGQRHWARISAFPLPLAARLLFAKTCHASLDACGIDSSPANADPRFSSRMSHPPVVSAANQVFHFSLSGFDEKWEPIWSAFTEDVQMAVQIRKRTWWWLWIVEVGINQEAAKKNAIKILQFGFYVIEDTINDGQAIQPIVLFNLDA